MCACRYVLLTSHQSHRSLTRTRPTHCTRIRISPKTGFSPRNRDVSPIGSIPVYPISSFSHNTLSTPKLSPLTTHRDAFCQWYHSVSPVASFSQGTLSILKQCSLQTNRDVFRQRHHSVQGRRLPACAGDVRLPHPPLLAQGPQEGHLGLLRRVAARCVCVCDWVCVCVCVGMCVSVCVCTCWSAFACLSSCLCRRLSPTARAATGSRAPRRVPGTTLSSCWQVCFCLNACSCACMRTCVHARVFPGVAHASTEQVFVRVGALPARERTKRLPRPT